MKKLKNFTIHTCKKFAQHSALTGIAMLILATLLLTLHQCLGITSNAPLTIAATLIITGVITIVWQIKHASRY